MSTPIQQSLPMIGPAALVPGPIFIAFELVGKPIHKARHRHRKIIPKDAWSYPFNYPVSPRYMTEAGVAKIFVQTYPDPQTEAYEKVIAEYAGLLMNRAKLAPTTKALALLVHSFREIPKSWSNANREAALVGAIRPTSRPDWDNHAKITDALNGVVWLDDAQVVDGRSLKYFSDRPALRIEVREFISPQ